MFAYLALALCVILTGVNLASLMITYWRCKIRPTPPVTHRPPVSIVRPVCGLETYSDETLRSVFEIDYPEFEVLFCVQRKTDPIIPLAEKIMAEYPHIPSRLLIGDDVISANPKLNNCYKGWQAASYDWIVWADSNVLAPKNYIERMLSGFRDDVGLVCSPPLGVRPIGFWSEVECAILNSFQARWQYCSEAIGNGFAQGKSMLWRREVVERSGGVAMLGAELAEDAAATKLMHKAGYRVQLSDRPFEQPLGRRSLRSVYMRQMRWARLRRASFPLYYTPEIFAVWFLPVIFGALAARGLDFPMIPVSLAVIAAWLLPELLFTKAMGWPLSWMSPLAFLVRDLSYPVLYLDAWLGDDFEWQGNAMSVREPQDDNANPTPLAR